MNKVFFYLLSPFYDVNSKCSTKGKNLMILDGIRGLAVLIVIASHTRAFCMHGQGSIGVFLFFFLSGIVLTIPYVDSPRTIFNIKELFIYFLNRVCRIVPLYIVMVAIYTLLGHENLQWFWWHITFLKGWNHLWSVAAEARFYLLFPAIIGALALFKNRYIHLILIAIFIYLSYENRGIYRIDMLDGRKVQLYFYMFLGGMFTCFLTSISFVESYLKKTLFEKIFNFFTLTVLLLFLFSSMEMVQTFWRPIFHDLPKNFVVNGWRIPGTWLFLFTIFFFTLITYRSGIVYRLLVGYFFRHIGLLSFSLYLTHMLVLQHLRTIGFQNEGLFFATLIVSYFIALLTYIFIEKPFLILKKHIAKMFRKEPVSQNSGQLAQNSTPVNVL